jgi:UDP-3-O-[3-hydroxymyristoyl] N-acetylglucosamine deacetylase
MVRECTIREKIGCVGIGLHTGKSIRLEILPAPAGHGITFERTDIKDPLVMPARYDLVTRTELATTIGQGENAIKTIEHLMAAFMGLSIDNARVLVGGPEVPIMDGSAAPFVCMLQESGIIKQKAQKKFAVVTDKVTVRLNDKWATISPASTLSLKYVIDFPHPLIGRQTFAADFSTAVFTEELARARTFGFLKDIEALKERRLALGGSLENAVVIDNYNVLNPGGLRYPDEFVRHKALDAVGDLALLGAPLIGAVEIYKGGHALHT